MEMVTTHYAHILALAFSSSGNALAILSAGGREQVLEIWYVHQYTSRILAYIKDQTHVPWLEADEDIPEAQLCWSPDDAYLAVARRSGAIDVWHVLESEQVLHSHLGEGCRALAWGNVSPSLTVVGATNVWYWRHMPYHPIEPSVKPIKEGAESVDEDSRMRFFCPETLRFSPDDRFVLAGGGWGGRAMYWVVSPSMLLGTFSFQVPSQLPIVNFFYSPDGTCLLIEHADQVDEYESNPLRARSMYMPRTRNWLVFGRVEQGCIGWSADSQRLLGTRQEIAGSLWLEQFNPWTGDEIGKTPIQASEIHMETLSLTRKGTQVSWAARQNAHSDPSGVIAIDSIPL